MIACETRPLNQGSRITAWELTEDGIPVTLISDSMSGYVMRKGLVDAVIVGADRIIEDAVFNKIGTYTHSVLAKAHGIPFYVAAPLSTFDFVQKEKDVVIEQRNPDELRQFRRPPAGPGRCRRAEPGLRRDADGERHRHHHRAGRLPASARFQRAIGKS